MGREEGHAVGSEVRVEVRGFVEAAPAHPAGQVPLRVLRAGVGRAGGRAVRSVRAQGGGGGGVPALRVPDSVGDEAVPAQRPG